nr:Na(+)/citrate cotransporter-like [Dermacentor andersoni]
MGEWELEEVGLELASFLKNVVELKLSEDKCREICALMAVSAVIMLTGISFGALITFLDVESTQINCTTYVLLLVLGMSAVSQLRVARGSPNCGGTVAGAGQMCNGGAAAVGARSFSLGLEAGLLNVPWGMLFLLGGHECLGKAAELAGVVPTMHSLLRQLSSYKPIIVQAVLVMWTSLLAEIWSSVEAHRALLGIVSELAAEMQVNPVYYTFPVTIAISTAGMLPGSALSIALLMDQAPLSTAKLLILGAASKLVAVVCTLISMNTVAVALYDFSNTSYPLAKDEVVFLPLQPDLPLFL